MHRRLNIHGKHGRYVDVRVEFADVRHLYVAANVVDLLVAAVHVHRDALVKGWARGRLDFLASVIWSFAHLKQVGRNRTPAVPLSFTK